MVSVEINHIYRHYVATTHYHLLVIIKAEQVSNFTYLAEEYETSLQNSCYVGLQS